MFYQNKLKIMTMAALCLFLASCAGNNKRTKTGAGVGAVSGAAAGAVLSGDGSEGTGAVVGGVVGAIIGGSVGNYLDKQAAELEQIAETRRTDNGIVTKLKGDLTFSTGKTSLKSNGAEQVRKIANIIKKYPKDRLLVIGHTDSTGSDMTNQQLSQARASSVRAILISNGVPAANIDAIGRGESQPITSNATASGRAKNRRVEIQITVAE